MQRHRTPCQTGDDFPIRKRHLFSANFRDNVASHGQIPRRNSTRRINLVPYKIHRLSAMRSRDKSSGQFTDFLDRSRGRSSFGRNCRHLPDDRRPHNNPIR